MAAEWLLVCGEIFMLSIPAWPHRVSELVLPIPTRKGTWSDHCFLNCIAHNGWRSFLKDTVLFSCTFIFMFLWHSMNLINISNLVKKQENENRNTMWPINCNDGAAWMPSQQVSIEFLAKMTINAKRLTLRPHGTPSEWISSRPNFTPLCDPEDDLRFIHAKGRGIGNLYKYLKSKLVH